MLKQSDSLEFLKTIDEYGLDIVYCDPPYALGSEVIIRKDGKVDYAKANDFMNKWEMPTGAYWEKWFTEAYRTLKHGGYLIMFGMDRQLLLFKYYAHLAGFEEQQSLYWYFISNFPKATDLSKMIDKNAGVEREQLEPSKNARPNGNKDTNLYELGTVGKEFNLTAPTTDLAKKYDGYKYSISPLKQTNETIMVFQKPCKTGSPLHDCLAYENGDKTITVSALNIDGNRVGTEIIGGGTMPDLRDVGKMSKESIGIDKLSFGQNTRPAERKEYEESIGRYPAQTFIDSQVAERLDLQSDNYSMSEDYEGGCSKILHKCDYTEEDYDLYFYEPKVSSSERNAGCDDLEKTQCILPGRNPTGNILVDQLHGYKEPSGNSHPTLKPIALNEKVLKLFKTPNPQKICYPFAGAGSEIIGGIKAGFDDWIGCEISQEYVDIANARIEYWKNTMSTQTTIFDFI